MKYFNIKFIFTAFLLFQFSLPVTASGILDKTTDQIIETLSGKISISGKTIQVNEYNIIERESRSRLPFSKVLRDSIAASLSKNGAVVTVSETGKRPLILTGTYGEEGDKLVITIRIREIGDVQSEDIAVARADIPINKLDSSLFKLDLKRVAESLVKRLEENYSGTETFDLKVKALRPGVKGETGILLGSEMKKNLSIAVTRSDILGDSFNRSPNSDTRSVLQGTYTILGDYIRFFVEVMDSQNRQVISASCNVKIKDIPPELLKTGSGEDITICIRYAPEAYNDIRADSPAVNYLLGKIGGALGKNGFKSRVCETDDTGGIKVKTSMSVKETGGGDYEFMSGTLILHLNSKDGNSIGTLEYKGRSVLRNDPDRAVNRVIDNIFKKNDLSGGLKNIILGEI